MGPTDYVSPTPLPEDRNKSGFRNAVFPRIPDDRQSPKSSNPECYTPLSEPFRIYFCIVKVGGAYSNHCVLKGSRGRSTSAIRSSHKTLVMKVCLYKECETCSFTVRETRRLRMFENTLHILPMQSMFSKTALIPYSVLRALLRSERFTDTRFGTW
jgi:hypothetical protein